MIDIRWNKAISNISDYLIEKKNDDDDEARTLHLLYEARELLEEGKRQDVRGAREEEGSTRSVEMILQNIKDRLTKIEKQNLSQTNTCREVRSLNGSYVITTKRNTIDDETHDFLRPIVIHYLIQTDNVLRKKEKKITIKILDKTKRRKICKRKVKKLIKKIKKIISELIKINRIRSKNIKITVLIKKVKTIFLKDTEWIKIIETLTTFR